jgi:dTDP-4-amino-4,6-dideoxygalactose transaminase
MSNTIQVLEKIPCLDLKGQHEQIKAEVFAAFERVYEKTAFSGGPFVEEFENAFAEYIGSKYAIGVNNGTTALHLAMLALGIGQGDEVIMPADKAKSGTAGLARPKSETSINGADSTK